MTGVLSPAALAFDAVAPDFDRRYGQWASVQAQRRAVRRELLRAFPPGSALLELGGGTGEDALFLAARGRRVLLTDASPAMLDCARRKVRAADAEDRVALQQAGLEQLPILPSAPFDGAYSNFAALNCVQSLAAVARGLAPLLRPGAPALLVAFGPLAVGEMVLHLLRGDSRTAFRRLSRGEVPARLGGRTFTVRYPGPRTFAAQFAPYFRLVRIRGIGVFVPPSAAEPGISRWPRLLRLLEWLDRASAAPLARLGDHLLLHFERTAEPAR